MSLLDLSPWQLLSDEVLFHIFSFVGVGDLSRCAQCCTLWDRVSRDTFLWENRFYIDWNLKRSVKRIVKYSWLDEYKRLHYHVPIVETEVLTEHTDRVFHVCFSHNGKMFVTCSRDGSLKIWNSTYPATLFHDIDLGFYGWQYAKFSQFNQSDTLLMVSGVPLYSSKVIVFNIGSTIRPVTIFHHDKDDIYAWYDDTHFVSSQSSIMSYSSNRCLLKLHDATKQNSGVVELFTFRNTNYHNFIITNQIDHPCEKYIIFITSYYPATQLGFKSLVDQTHPNSTMDHLLNMHGHITGLTISTNHEYLYVQVIPDMNFETLTYEIYVHVIDLRNRRDIGVLYKFKPDLSKQVCFQHPMNSSDGSDEFLACGGIDNRGYLLDFYGLCVSTFAHDDRVNSVALNPKDSEMLVSVSNDFKVKIWYSHNRAKEFKINARSKV